MSHVTRYELRTVAVFQDLPDEQLDWFLEHATELVLAPGESYIRAGNAADRMFVVLDGELQVQFEGANENVFTISAGSVTGLLPYSRMTVFPGTGRALQTSRILTFPATRFEELLSRMPLLGRRLVGIMVDRTREVTRGGCERTDSACFWRLERSVSARWVNRRHANR